MFAVLRPCKMRQVPGNRHFQAMRDTLVLLHVIFRHGDRTPDKLAIYPNDPHKDHDYSPYGFGQLTTVGKKRAYRFGQSLRERYGQFLGDYYETEHLDAWASNIDRTKITLQLALASLYLLKDEQVWFEHTRWQNIPFQTMPFEEDKIFLPCYFDKHALAEYNNYANGPGKDVMKSYGDIIDYIEEHSGIKVDGPRAVVNLLCTLTSQQNMGLKLPEWTKEVWPHLIEEIAMKEFEFMSATPRLTSLIIGKLFQKIVEDSLSKIKGESKRKVHLYSGHDYTVAMFLKTINVFDSRHPDFCSNVAVELHKIDGVYGFKIKYQRTENDHVKLLEIPNVGAFWPIEDFMEYNKYILEDRPYELNM